MVELHEEVKNAAASSSAGMILRFVMIWNFSMVKKENPFAIREDGQQRDVSELMVFIGVLLVRQR